MGHVAYSTPEGELAAIAYALRQAGCPGMVMWDALQGKPPQSRQIDPDQVGAGDDLVDAEPPPAKGKTTRYLIR